MLPLLRLRNGPSPDVTTAETLVSILRHFESFNDADTIAAFLQVRGIKGVPGQASACALARYLKRTPGAQNVRVFPEHTVYRASKFTISIQHRDVVGEFIKQFDRGMYPELLYGVPAREPIQIPAPAWLLAETSGQPGSVNQRTSARAVFEAQAATVR